MNPVNPIPMSISVQQAVLVLACLLTTMALLRQYAHSRVVSTVIRLWVFGTAIASWRGLLSQFETVPPPLVVFIVIQLAALIWFLFFSPTGKQLIRIPQWILLVFQSFRIPVEIILAELAGAGLLAPELTYHGYNFDIASGFLGLALGLIVRSQGEARWRKAILAYNFLGLALLFNIVIRAAGSFPTPFRFIHYPIDTSVMAFFPMQWLPLFLVPLALSLHLVSIRRALAREAAVTPVSSWPA